MPRFKPLYERALDRKGGTEALTELLPSPRTSEDLQDLAEDRYLAMMTKCINQAGFSWKVIEKKWPEFEEAFFAFKIDTLSLLSDEQWEAYTQDRRVVRNWQKIKTVRDNMQFILNERSLRNGGFPELIAHWPESDQIGLLVYLKKHGSRLGGQTAQWFLRNIRKDGFILTKDVVGALISIGLDIKEQPTSKREFKLIQETFNDWQQETGLCMTHLSKIAAFSYGENYELETLA